MSGRPLWVPQMDMQRDDNVITMFYLSELVIVSLCKIILFHRMGLTIVTSDKIVLGFKYIL